MQWKLVSQCRTGAWKDSQVELPLVLWAILLLEIKVPGPICSPSFENQAYNRPDSKSAFLFPCSHFSCIQQEKDACKQILYPRLSQNIALQLLRTEFEKNKPDGNAVPVPQASLYRATPAILCKSRLNLLAFTHHSHPSASEDSDCTQNCQVSAEGDKNCLISHHSHLLLQSYHPLPSPPLLSAGRSPFGHYLRPSALQTKQSNLITRSYRCDKEDLAFRVSRNCYDFRASCLFFDLLLFQTPMLTSFIWTRSTHSPGKETWCCWESCL